MGICCSKSKQLPPPTTSLALNPLITTPHSIPFPKDGVSLDYLKRFIEENGGREAFQGLTTTDVCERVVKPMTSQRLVSVCEFLRLKESLMVGNANVFVSHAWRYQFLEVIDSLFDHFEGKERTEDNPVIVWFDIFSNNQHKATELPFEWWATTFKSAIAEFHHTVLVMAPFESPIPFTRSCCIWEMYCTIITGSIFEVACTRSSMNTFLTFMEEKGEEAIFLFPLQLEAEKSEAFKFKDQEKIHDVISSTVGFKVINDMIPAQIGQIIAAIVSYRLAQLQDQVGEEASEEEENRENEKKRNILQVIVYLLYYAGKDHPNRHDMALEFMEQFLATEQEIRDEEDPYLVRLTGYINDIKQRKLALLMENEKQPSE